MPSNEHELKIEEINREILSRGMDWKTKKNYPLWLPHENSWGLIDLIGFKKATQTSYPEVDGYEVEELSSNIQKNRNWNKLETLKISFPFAKVTTCQLNSNQDHKQACPRFKTPIINNKNLFNRNLRFNNRSF